MLAPTSVSTIHEAYIDNPIMGKTHYLIKFSSPLIGIAEILIHQILVFPQMTSNYFISWKVHSTHGLLPA